MNIGKALFAQLMDFLPWSTFARIVARYGGDARVRTLCCAHLPSVHPFIELPDLIIRAAQAEWAGHRLHQCRRPLWHRAIPLEQTDAYPPSRSWNGQGHAQLHRGALRPEACQTCADTAYGSAATLNWIINEKQIATHIPAIVKPRETTAH